MAITAARVTVTTSATKICENTATSSLPDTANLSFLLINQSVTDSIFLGPSGVTTSNGVEWKVIHGPSFAVDLEPGESLYGIVPTTSQSVHVLGGGR